MLVQIYTRYLFVGGVERSRGGVVEARKSRVVVDLDHKSVFIMDC